MGLFDDLFDDAADLVGFVTEPVREAAGAVADAVGLDTNVDLVDVAVLAGLLGVEVALVRLAIRAGCATVGEVRDFASSYDGGTFGGGGADV